MKTRVEAAPAAAPFKTLPRNLAVGVLFNTAIATGLTLVRGGGFFPSFVYSQCIGLAILLIVDGVRRVIWGMTIPPIVPMVALSASGIVTGFLIGTTLAILLVGGPAKAEGYSALHDRVSLAVTVFAGIGATWYFLSRERMAKLRLQTEAIERGAIEARLKLLQAQIEPHFLFNTLANLHSLIETDPERARKMLEHFDDYLRATLAATRRDSGTLGDEFALVRGYLELLAIRMGPRLAFSLSVEKKLSASKVPPMLLQPLVENAVKHGLEPKTDGGRIEVSACAVQGSLMITVSDTGLGLGRAATNGSGVGLQHVKDRIAAAYGDRGSLTIEGNPAGGTSVTVRIPLET